MKVICIRSSSCLTINKVYEVICTNNDDVWDLIDDSGEINGWFKERFVLLEDIREEKLNKLFNI